MADNQTYLCIDLKTFYASVECVERHLDPFKTNLVVADESRGKGALCLAISPKMKTTGVHNRCRLFEIPQNLHYIIAKPRMNLYIKYSADIYAIYLKYIAKEDIHVYSIDEVFIDATKYLSIYKVDGISLARMLIDAVYKQTGITATVGVGTNLYLAKIAMDITAKHVKGNMGVLDEKSYQDTLWHHTPLTDFWSIGRGIARRLEKYKVTDMYGIAHLDESILYKEFGVNAEYLIDHAWGRETCTMRQIKAYKSKNNSLSNSQILFHDYNYDKALLVLKEMVELGCLDLVDKHLVTNNVSLGIGYADNIISYTGGGVTMLEVTNSYSIILQYFINLYKETTNKDQPIRSVAVSFNNVIDEEYEQYNLFVDTEEINKERRAQETIITIKKRFGKNAVLRGMNLEKGATTCKRNKLVGGHNAE